jgi:nucleotide-binding universal stress UspA family protein
LSAAAQITGDSEGTIFVLHVVPPVGGPIPVPQYLDPTPARQHHAHEELEQIAKKFLRHVQHELIVGLGDPATVIVSEQIRLGADLIVMTTHSRHGVPHALLGSVAESVVRNAECPVLTVGPEIRIVSG